MRTAPPFQKFIISQHRYYRPQRIWVSAPGGPGGDPPGTATAAGGTHPTGVHSCSFKVSAI